MKKQSFHNIKIISTLVIIIMLLTKALSFFRDLKITSTLGASYESDAFNIAYLLAITIFGFISSAYGNSIMPIASELYLSDRKKMHDSVNNILTISSIIAILIIVICFLFPNIFVKMMAANIEQYTFILANRLARIGIISLLFLVFNGAYSILLRIYNRNIIPTLGELIFPIPILIGLFLGVSNVYILVMLIVLGYAAQFGIEIFNLYQLGYRFKPTINLKDKQLKRMLKLMPPILVSTGLLQINTILDNQIASNFGAGSITSLMLASKINGLAYTVFATSLMQIIYSKLSKAYAKKDMNEFQHVLMQQTKMILTFIVPATLCLIIFSKEIVQLLFVRGNFTSEAGKVTATILNGYAIGLIFFVLRDICNYCFYSSQNTKLPAKIATISIGINLILNLILSKFMGIKGIAYATSIAGIISLIILLYNIKTKMNNIKLFKLMDILKYILSSIIMIILMLLLKNIWPNKLIFSFLIMGIGAIVFWIIKFLLDKIFNKQK